MRAALGPGPFPWPGRARCGRILHRRSGPFSSSLLLQRGGTRPSSPEISLIFPNRQKPDTRFLSVAAFSMDTYGVVRARDRRGNGRSGWADGVRSVAQGGARFPFGVRPGRAILCSCEHGVDRIRAMLNPSASNGAGLRDSAARSGIEAGRTKAVQDAAASANQTPMPSHGSRIGMAGATAMQDFSGSSATGTPAGTRARAQLAPDLRGWVLSSVGQAKPDQGSAGRSSGAMQDRA